MIKYLLPFLLILGGCVSQPQKTGTTDWELPVIPEASQQVVDGSLYSTSYVNNLFADRMAYRVGDILTINLEEQTQSSKSSGTSFDKESSLSIPAPIFWGEAGMNSSAEANRDFSGGGSSSQENMLRGSITVSVVKVQSNGTLVIQGEKSILLNQGNEYLWISGILRAEDIASDNTVSSQRLANARIAYSGDGAIADSNTSGWLTRVFNSPIFPM